MTPFSAEHKFGHPFQFHSTGLFLWTMNEVPTISGAAATYLARVRCYRFDVSFLGKSTRASKPP